MEDREWIPRRCGDDSATKQRISSWPAAIRWKNDPKNKADWRLRKEAYLRDLETVPLSVLLVSAADKLHNARSMVRDFLEVGDAVWMRFKGIRDEILWYYRSLIEIFQKRGEHRMLVDELTRTVAEVQRLAFSA